jgi:hypothetical protein
LWEESKQNEIIHFMKVAHLNVGLIMFAQHVCDVIEILSTNAGCSPLTGQLNKCKIIIYHQHEMIDEISSYLILEFGTLAGLSAKSGFFIITKKFPIHKALSIIMPYTENLGLWPDWGEESQNIFRAETC